MFVAKEAVPRACVQYEKGGEKKYLHNEIK